MLRSYKLVYFQKMPSIICLTLNAFIPLLGVWHAWLSILIKDSYKLNTYIVLYIKKNLF